MSNGSVPHPLRSARRTAANEMGGKQQTFGVRAFPPWRQSTYRGSFDSPSPSTSSGSGSLRMTAGMGHGARLATPESLVYEEAAS